MRPRLFLILLLIVGLAPGTWLRSPPAPRDHRSSLAIKELAIPVQCCRLSPLTLKGAWQLSSQHVHFGGYSALSGEAPGRLLAISDAGYFLRFAEPDRVAGPAEFGKVKADWNRLDRNHDIESYTALPDRSQQWVAVETNNAIIRLDPSLRQTGLIAPAMMRGWHHNLGPEAMLRLGDGRFVVISEGYQGWFDHARHAALLFDGDPVSSPAPRSFTFRGIDGYRPTDMAQLPDGRVLVVMRRIVRPFPIRLSIRLLLADPAQIRADGEWTGQDLGEIAAPSLVDDFEGIAVIARPGGPIRVWMISDDNASAFERTLLLAWELDPAVPAPAAAKQKGARESSRTPLH